MLKKLNKLSFVIGLFFIIISLILLIDYIIIQKNAEKVNLYTGITFFAFGLIMIAINSDEGE